MSNTHSKLISGRSCCDPREGDLVEKKDEPTLVLLVTNRGTMSFFAATVIHSENGLRPIGFNYDQWRIDEFTDFRGKIEIGNI